MLSSVYTEMELIDELTNVVMDIIRRRFNINDDLDDELYGEIHEAIKNTLRETLK